MKPSVGNKRFTYSARTGTNTLTIRTKGLAKGSYTLTYRFGREPTIYGVGFTL